MGQETSVSAEAAISFFTISGFALYRIGGNICLANTEWRYTKHGGWMAWARPLARSHKVVAWEDCYHSFVVRAFEGWRDRVDLDYDDGL